MPGTKTGAWHLSALKSVSLFLVDALDGIGTLLNSAGQAYSQTEQQIASSMGSS